MATRHASAVKAHRQTLKRTAHNRELRSRLRTALKTIRAAIDAGKTDEAEGRAEPDVLDRRQDGGQGHHPRQRGRPLQVASREAHRASRRLAVVAGSSAHAGRSAPASASRQLHHQPFDQHPFVAARALEREVRPQQRVDAPAARAPAPPAPASTTPTTAAARPARAASRRARAAARSRAARAPRRRRRSHSRPPSRRRPTTRRDAISSTSAGVMLVCAFGVEQQPLDVAAQLGDVAAGALDQQLQRRLDRSSGPRVSISCANLGRRRRAAHRAARRRRRRRVPRTPRPRAFSTRRFVNRRVRSTSVATNTSVVDGDGTLEIVLERAPYRPRPRRRRRRRRHRSPRPSRARFGLSNRSARSTMTMRRSPSIGNTRAAAAMSTGDAAGLAGVDALDGERPVGRVDRRLDRVDDLLDRAGRRRRRAGRRAPSLRLAIVLAESGGIERRARGPRTPRGSTSTSVAREGLRRGARARCRPG